MDAVVICTGQSLTAAQVENVRVQHAAGRCLAVAVSNAWELAPWADALVSNDRAWWQHHSAAMGFPGRKFAGVQVRGTELLRSNRTYESGCNSGLQGMRVAHEYLGATRILLIGLDMHGSHYFGPHPTPLRNTTPQRFEKMLRQFKRWRGCQVVNCSPGSALTQFPMGDLFEALRP